MSKPKQRGERRQQILECLAQMLEDTPGGRITTAKLAANVKAFPWQALKASI